MSNHPWRARNGTFNCPPDCENRKPGCQDHCEQHAKDKAKYEERKRVELQRTNVDDYVISKLAYNSNQQVLHAKHKRRFQIMGE